MINNKTSIDKNTVIIITKLINKIQALETENACEIPKMTNQMNY